MSDSDSIFDEETDGQLKPGTVSPVLHVYEMGELTVVGFAGKDVPDEMCVAAYREQLTRIVQDHDCKTLVFDLTGVRFMPSGMLGLLVSLHNLGLKIELYNPSEDIRETLDITKLGQLFTIREVEL